MTSRLCVRRSDRLRMASTLAGMALALGACESLDETFKPGGRSSAEAKPAITHESLDATLWVQSSAEYRTMTIQTYRLARIRLRQALRDKTWTALPEQRKRKGLARLRPAVIMDVDETLLDNSPFQARLVRSGEPFTAKAWTDWVTKANAPAVPGAAAFVRYARSKGVRVFFVTNRDARAEVLTRKNLARRGIRVPAKPDRLFMKGERKDWGADKIKRRALIARRHRVLLLIGDDMNDFVPARLETADARRSVARKHLRHIGRRWILLPNPQYGSWESALYGRDNKLSRADRVARKYNALKTAD